MAYATVDDLLALLGERELIQLTDDEDTGTVNTARADKALADADAEVDGYLAGRYPVPLATPPAVIVKYAADIAVYNLYSRKGEPGENTVTRYKAALKWLQLAASGTVTIGGDGAPTPSGGQDLVQVAQSNPSRVFSRGSMEGF